jgi:tetratricopeptide (TPR) repeat protein
LVDRGLTLRQLGRHDEAQADFDRALTLRPDDPLALIARSQLRIEHRDHARAIEDCDAVLRLQPDNDVALGNRGVARDALGDTAGSKADIDRALAVNPGNPVTWRNRAAIKRRERDLPGAIADYSRAIELWPEYAAAWGGRGSSHGQSGDRERSIADLTRAIELDGSDADFFYYRALANFLLQGDVDDALSDLESAIKIDPKHPGALVNRGLIRRRHGRLREAIDDYTRAIAVEPSAGPPRPAGVRPRRRGSQWRDRKARRFHPGAPAARVATGRAWRHPRCDR